MVQYGKGTCLSFTTWVSQWLWGNGGWYRVGVFRPGRIPNAPCPERKSVHRSRCPEGSSTSREDFSKLWEVCTIGLAAPLCRGDHMPFTRKHIVYMHMFNGFSAAHRAREVARNLPGSFQSGEAENRAGAQKRASADHPRKASNCSLDHAHSASLNHSIRASLDHPRRASQDDPK